MTFIGCGICDILRIFRGLSEIFKKYWGQKLVGIRTKRQFGGGRVGEIFFQKNLINFTFFFKLKIYVEF